MKHITYIIVTISVALTLSACCCPNEKQIAEMQEANKELQELNEDIKKASEKGAAKPSKKKTKKAKAKKKAKPIVVSSKQLFIDYDDNEIAADEKYKGNTIEVSGKVTDIGKDMFDNLQLSLQGKSQFMSVMATLEDSQKSKASKLKKGQKVTLICTGKGKILTSPMLDDCVIN